jgi:hypothetical protein
MPVGATVFAIGTVIELYASHKKAAAEKAAGTAAQDAANSQADLADYNAHVADVQSQDAIEVGADQESRFREGVRGAIGTQRVNAAAQGVDVGFGSPVDVQSDAAYLGELDALQIKNNAKRTAWGYKVQASDLRASATIARKTGVYAEQAGRANASATLLGGYGTAVAGAGSLYAAKYGIH